MTLTIHKGYLSGAIGRIVELHAQYYSTLVGFGLPFESKVARELVEFCERYGSERDGLWLALQDGQIEGAIAIDGSHAEQDGAHLRWFIASDHLRGTGAGTALLTTAMDFADHDMMDGFICGPLKGWVRQDTFTRNSAFASRFSNAAHNGVQK